jgi:hypothetical protein
MTALTHAPGSCGLVTHPSWCAAEVCSATAAAGSGETHRSVSVEVGVENLISRLRLSATLVQSHAPWPTSVYVDLEIRTASTPSGGPARSITLTVDEAREVAAALAGLVELEAP